MNTRQPERAKEDANVAGTIVLGRQGMLGPPLLSYVRQQGLIESCCAVIAGTSCAMPVSAVKSSHRYVLFGSTTSERPLHTYLSLDGPSHPMRWYHLLWPVKNATLPVRHRAHLLDYYLEMTEEYLSTLYGPCRRSRYPPLLYRLEDCHGGWRLENRPWNNDGSLTISSRRTSRAKECHFSADRHSGCRS